MRNQWCGFPGLGSSSQYVDEVDSPEITICHKFYTCGSLAQQSREMFAKTTASRFGFISLPKTNRGAIASAKKRIESSTPRLLILPLRTGEAETLSTFKHISRRDGYT